MATLGRHADAQRRAMGEVYFLQGRVQDVTLRGDVLTAEVAGSGSYHVTIRLGDDRIQAVGCSCPFDGHGWCKHVAATVLALCRDGGILRKRSTLRELLAGHDQDALVDLVERLVQHDPDLLDVIEDIIQPGDAGGSGARQPTAARRGKTDAQAYRRRIRSVLHGLEETPAYEMNERVDEAVRALRAILDDARAYTEAGDAESALVALEILTDECLENDYLLEYGGVRTFPWDLNVAWTEALLTADLPAPQRGTWANRLEAWQRGDDDERDEEELDSESRFFDAAFEAARHGWNAPRLQEKSSASQPADEEADEDWEPENELASIAVDLLRRQGRRDEALALARQTGRAGEVVALLAEAGSIRDALEHGLEHATDQEAALIGARALWAAGARAEALRLARHGLRVNGDSHDLLAPWLLDAALQEGASELAGEAAQEVFHRSLRLEDYLLARRLAGKQWPAMRNRLLDYVRLQRHHHSDRVAILLAEGLVEEAMALAERLRSQDVVEPVVEAVAASHPDWVIEAARGQVGAILGPGDPRTYENAAWWLEKCREAHLAIGRGEAWRDYIENLIEGNRRSRKLRAILEGFH